MPFVYTSHSFGYLEKKKKLYHIFVDLEKAFDEVPKPAIRWALRRQVVPESLIDLVMAQVYSETRSRVRVAGETSDSFEIRVGVHPGSVLNPLLFILVMEEATRECRVGSLGSLEQVEGNIEPSVKQVYSTAPPWKGIRGLNKICHALWGSDVGTYRETDKYIAWL